MSVITMATGSFPLKTDKGYWGLVSQLSEDPPPELGSEFSDQLRSFVNCW
jgi:hypothetical protein